MEFSVTYEDEFFHNILKECGAIDITLCETSDTSFEAIHRKIMEILFPSHSPWKYRLLNPLKYYQGEVQDQRFLLTENQKIALAPLFNKFNKILEVISLL